MPTTTEPSATNNNSMEKGWQEEEQVRSAQQFAKTQVCDLLGMRAVLGDKRFPVSLWSPAGLDLEPSSVPACLCDLERAA